MVGPAPNNDNRPDAMTTPERSRLFPDAPVIRFRDPFAALLGIGEDDGILTYTFDDAVKLAGHYDPTVAGAFLVVKRAVELLYGATVPERGQLRVTIAGTEDQGINGPMSQIFTLITGSAGDNGFQGLHGRYIRRGLLNFDGVTIFGPGSFTFERLDTGQVVTLSYDPTPIPADPATGEDLLSLLHGDEHEEVLARFRHNWHERIRRILSDGGETTVRELDRPSA